jgi:hypothetical protein
LLRIEHKDKELWDSRTFIAPDLGETCVTLDHELEKIKLIFDLIVQKDLSQSIEIIVESPDKLRIRCVNWNDPSPTTLQELLEVGEFIGRRLFIIFSCAKLGSHGQIRQIHLSIYLGAKTNG